MNFSLGNGARQRIAALALVLFASGAASQTYPERPIRLVVPFPTGGNVDSVARAMSGKLAEELGVPVIVENRGGAGGAIGSEAVARSTPDGYTILMAGSSHGILNSIRKNLPYHAVNSFAPVALVGSVPMVLVVHPSLPVKNYNEFVAFDKSKPDALKCGISTGAANHLATALYKSRSSSNLILVPYKGDGPTITDLLGGHINCYIGLVTVVRQHIEAERLRPLAVASSERLRSMANVPTFAEVGLDGFNPGSWNGIFAPAGVPAAVVNRLSEAAVRTLKDPRVNAALTEGGVMVLAGGPNDLRQFLDSEISRWDPVVKAVGLAEN